jgi:hypothetical protein
VGCGVPFGHVAEGGDHGGDPPTDSCQHRGALRAPVAGQPGESLFVRGRVPLADHAVDHGLSVHRRAPVWVGLMTTMVALEAGRVASVS